MTNNPYELFEKDPAIVALKTVRQNIGILIIGHLRAKEPLMNVRTIARRLKITIRQYRCLMSGDLEPFSLDQLIYISVTARLLENKSKSAINTHQIARGK